MLRVLVADDEQLERQALRMVLELERHDCQVVGSASTGGEAVKLAEEKQPDLVFMDIKMPGMGGLQAIRRLRSMMPDVRVVILSAYDEFAYAQEAIRLGTFDYLLKPAQPSEICRIVGEVARQVSRERQWQKRQRDELRRQEEAAIRLRASLVYDLIMENVASEAEARERVADLGLPTGSVAPMVIRWSCDGIINGESVSDIDQEVKNRVAWAAKQVLRDCPDYLVLPLGRDGVVALRFFPPDNSDEEWPQEVEHIGARMAEMGVLNAAVGWGQPQDRLISLGESFREAERALHYGCLPGAEGVATRSVMGRSQGSGSGASSPEERHLLHFIGQGDTQRAHEALDSLVPRVLQENQGREAMRMQCRRLLISMVRAGVEAGISSQSAARLSREAITELSGKLTLAQLLTWLKNCLDQLLDISRHNMSHGGRNAISAARAYLQRNYHYSVGLEEVAEAVQLSPHYFSRRFKAETGESFIEYLTGLRLAEARKLLTRPNIPVAEVAERVGFTEGAYFSRVFRRAEGVTPTQYRRSAGEREGERDEKSRAKQW